MVGIKNRQTGEVRASVVPNTARETLQGFIQQHVRADLKKYTDEAIAYKGLLNHEAVQHSIGKWVDGLAHTNGMESFWAMLKRAYHGTYHRMSVQHCTDTSRSLLAVTTSVTRIRSIKCGIWWPEWSGSG